MLVDAKDCNDSCKLPTAKVSKAKHSNRLVIFDGEQRQVTVSNVLYAEYLAHKLTLVLHLKKKGEMLKYTN
ncbi:hypothetical protein DD238_006906 [Peronospora effusa]|uniref:Uncharacterized protein n=1 Tax=Peronospora effusa TaxID=542832 RepID=A0A3M6VIR8_9STRA|nr:hypothetical protein DD238_006906 [Peronospora effusa]